MLVNKLGKHHTAYLKDIHYSKDDSKPWKHRKNTKFENGYTVMVKYHVHHAFKSKYLMNYTTEYWK